jgi:hypothetical protein
MSTCERLDQNGLPCGWCSNCEEDNRNKNGITDNGWNGDEDEENSK